MSSIRIRGYSSEEIRFCFMRLQVQGILRAIHCADSEGARYDGKLVGLSRLGCVLLESLSQSNRPHLVHEGA